MLNKQNCSKDFKENSKEIYWFQKHQVDAQANGWH